MIAQDACRLRNACNLLRAWASANDIEFYYLEIRASIHDDDIASAFLEC